jgi:anaerobic ribonucleoside-triphosphate reductase
MERVMSDHVPPTSPESAVLGHLHGDATDAALFVRTSSEGMENWNRRKIVDALIRETYVDPDTAEKISLEVEQQIFRAGTKVLTAPLVRELVDAKLIEFGLESARRMHTRLGMPLYDVEQLITRPNRENANVPHGPEATNLTLAENIKKEYALLSVFPEDVGDAHMKGDIHLHDLGFIDRPYCSGQSLEYVKKFGLNLPNALSIAKPAKHPEVLLAHMVKFAAALQSHFAGAIGWDAINIFFAPYLVGMSDRDIKQLAQILIFEFSQQAVARGGQAIFSDINLYWEVPKHFEEVPAIGPGGEYTGKTYGEYLPEAQKFVWALFEVYREGDGSGRPFFFPKPLVHITEKLFRTPGHEEFLNHICDVAATRGNTYFVFDRGDTAKISECCRLSFKLDARDLSEAKTPWKMRYSALQNVTLNLPRAAYRAEGSDTRLYAVLTDMLELAAKAHFHKKNFIAKLLSLKEQGPLALLTMEPDGEPYLRIERCSFLIGMLGLNELVQAHTGAELHESDEAFRFGLQIISHLKLVTGRLAEKYGLKLVLEQTPAESTAYRMAKLDLQFFPKQAERHVKGNLATGEVYYTNSTYLNVGVPLNPIERVRKEGLFHPLIEAGNMTHVWLGESRPSAASIANFVTKTFRTTESDQICFSPEFTTCNDCLQTNRGLSETCVSCGSANVDGITRITGYFTRTSSWNKGKRAELIDRYRNVEYFEEKVTPAAAGN